MTQARLVTTDRARGRVDRLASVAEVLARGVFPSGKRHPNSRSGERRPIPLHVRVAVWLRDRGLCELCQSREQVQGSWHLDHITPWSAGGADTTDNLRVLCERHNLDRSNLVDPNERPRMPATWWCENCRGTEVLVNEWGSLVCTLHEAWQCRVVAGYRRHLEQTGELPTWFAREWSDDADLVVAYCAHCGHPGRTERPL